MWTYNVQKPVRIRHSSHEFATQSSHCVDRSGWQAKMASIEIWILWRNVHKSHSFAKCCKSHDGEKIDESYCETTNFRAPLIFVDCVNWVSLWKLTFTACKLVVIHNLVDARSEFTKISIYKSGKKLQFTSCLGKNLSFLALDRRLYAERAQLETSSTNCSDRPRKHCSFFAYLTSMLVIVHAESATGGKRFFPSAAFLLLSFWPFCFFVFK